MQVRHTDRSGSPTDKYLSGGWYVTRPCTQIDGFYQDPDTVLSFYPGCASFYDGSNPTKHVVVAVDFNSEDDAMPIAAALGITFGAAGWLAWWIHAVLVEVYLRLTPAESERLREVSYERQKERGMKHPGSAGLVAQSLGDANPYMPISKRRQADSLEELDLLATKENGVSHERGNSE